jgi:hypothetical protein
MNIFEEFVKAAPVKTPLDFGHNENVVIESIDFGIRKRKGITIKANTFIRLTKIDPKTKKVLASTEISFWDLDPTKDFAKDNFMSQFSILAGIISALDGDMEKFENDIMAVLEDTTDNYIIKFLKNATNTKKLQSTMIKAFKEQVEDKIGLDSKLLKCKMVSNKSGYMEPANDISWILPMDSDEELPRITSRELAIRKKALAGDNKVAPDKTGKAPDKVKSTEKKVAANSLDSL